MFACTIGAISQEIFNCIADTRHSVQVSSSGLRQILTSHRETHLQRHRLRAGASATHACENRVKITIPSTSLRAVQISTRANKGFLWLDRLSLPPCGAVIRPPHTNNQQPHHSSTNDLLSMNLIESHRRLRRRGTSPKEPRQGYSPFVVPQPHPLTRPVRLPGNSHS